MTLHDGYGTAPPRPHPDEVAISRRSLLRLGWTPAARADVDYDGATARVREAAELGVDPGLLRALEPVGAAIAGLLEPSAGERVLDAGAGDGNVALACVAAGAGAVDACDLAATMVARGRERTGVRVGWRRADLQALPYPDAAFDAIVSAFALPLAPRPRRAARELARVCRPGGRMAIAAWAPRGLPGRLLEELERLAPAPLGIRSPVEWGRPEVARERLAPWFEDLVVRTRSVPLRFPSPDALFAALLPATLDRATREALRPRFDRHLAAVNDRPGATETSARYLLVTGRRAR